MSTKLLEISIFYKDGGEDLALKILHQDESLYTKTRGASSLVAFKALDRFTIESCSYPALNRSTLFIKGDMPNMEKVELNLTLSDLTTHKVQLLERLIRTMALIGRVQGHLVEGEECIFTVWSR